MSATVRFENPPGCRTDRRDWIAIGEALRKRPQKWAIVAVYPTPQSAASTARQIRNSTLSALKSIGTFEAVSRTVDGESRVYARWVGEPS